MSEKEKETKAVEESAQQIDLNNENLTLDEETIAKVKDAIADEVREDAGISEEQAEAFKKMLEEATMPVELTNAEFKLGANELDIRSLSKENLIQMFFRTQELQLVWLKNISTSLIDIMRLVMILLDKRGVKNIVKATDDIIEKIKKQNQENYPTKPLNDKKELN